MAGGVVVAGDGGGGAREIVCEQWGSLLQVDPVIHDVFFPFSFL